MNSVEPSTLGISCCFDEKSWKLVEKLRKNGLGKASRIILAELSSKGLAGATSLELGCGTGVLTIGLLRSGVTSAVGIDLSPKMIEAARAFALESGFASNAEFDVGDGAQASLRRADFVVLDSVLCCYPDVPAFVKNSSSASLRYYAISLPDSRRAAAKFLRLLLPLQSLMVGRRDFRFRIPRLEEIQNQLTASGFRQVFDSSAGYVWSVLVFAAPATK